MQKRVKWKQHDSLWWPPKGKAKCERHVGSKYKIIYKKEQTRSQINTTGNEYIQTSSLKPEKQTKTIKTDIWCEDCCQIYFLGSCHFLISGSSHRV